MPILSFYSKFEEAVGYSKEFGEEVWAKSINFGVGSIKVMPTSAQSPSCVPLFAAPWTVVQQFLCPWDFHSKNTGVSCHFLLEGSS